MVKFFLNTKYNVEDPDSTRSFGKGEKREDFADAWQNTGSTILIGLAGSGKAQLAGMLAGHTGQEVCKPDTVDSAVKCLGESRKIVVLSDELVEDHTVQPLIHGAGKVFYLMCDSQTLAFRVAEQRGIEDREQLWRDMSARLVVMEPVFYSTLHFILQAAQTPEELLADTLEKIAF